MLLELTADELAEAAVYGGELTCPGCDRPAQIDPNEPSERWVSRRTMAGLICDNCANRIDANWVNGFLGVEVELQFTDYANGVTCPECALQNDVLIFGSGPARTQCRSCGAVFLFTVVPL